MSAIKTSMVETAKNEKAERFKKIAEEVANLVAAKNLAYGDAFGQAGEVLKIMYPNGIVPEQYDDVLGIARVLDKLFRVANRKSAFGENPWLDIMGYSLLAVERESRPGS